MTTPTQEQMRERRLRLQTLYALAMAGDEAAGAAFDTEILHYWPEIATMLEAGAAAIERVSQFESGEYICRKCGIRQEQPKSEPSF